MCSRTRSNFLLSFSFLHLYLVENKKISLQYCYVDFAVLGYFLLSIRTDCFLGCVSLIFLILFRTNSNRVEKYLTFGTLAAGQKLAFDDCARGLRILTCMNEAICTCLQITLALKY